MGPLAGHRVIEILGIGPGPFCGMMLADMGAEVISIDRPGGNPLAPETDVHRRGRRHVQLDLKSAAGRALLLDLCESADGLFEGFRPGVAERLGIGPAPCMARNPKLVYGRMTGWGQDGPLAHRAGHDINYIAISGALHAIGPKDGPPVPPLNLVGDFGGGGMLLAFGMVCGLLEAAKSGKGQVVDAAMLDGANLLMSMFLSHRAHPIWGFVEQRESNLLDGGAHFYRCYETADGQAIAVGAIEPQFYAELIARAGLDATTFEPQFDRARWPEMAAAMAKLFKTKTRDEWTALLQDCDACFAPVLSHSEAETHPHNAARDLFQTIDGVVHPAPAPRFSRTPGQPGRLSDTPGADTRAVLSELGLDEGRMSDLQAEGIISGV